MLFRASLISILTFLDSYINSLLIISDTLYTLNLCNVVCQLYLNNAEEHKSLFICKLSKWLIDGKCHPGRMEGPLSQWFSKCSPWISIICITWELVRNANSLAPPQASWARNWWGRPAIRLLQTLQMIPMQAKIWEPLLSAGWRCLVKGLSRENTVECKN